LFSEAGGGSKARMLQYIMNDVSRSTYDVVVTAGGPCSNFNRACALMCAKIGVKMHLVEYTDELEEYDTSLNYFICNLADIRKTRCNRTVVAQTIESVIADYKAQGLRVKFIYGGGRTIEGIYAYYKAVEEFAHQCDTVDDVFLACGTGTTLTGICAGFQKFFPNAKIHAISTARRWEVEKPVLDEDMEMLNGLIRSTFTFDNLTFYDGYLCGGYDKATPELLDTIKECISREGMIIDPCYSGKAFYGMTQVIEANRKSFEEHKVLFWNTGGIFNLLSQKDNFKY
jgi:1-aminocyclopropane-1-carboxylate deaminase/D-cysteine desulfhydrase-like pyridoxal-dependent ACC family enzyme